MSTLFFAILILGLLVGSAILLIFSIVKFVSYKCTNEKRKKNIGLILLLASITIALFSFYWLLQIRSANISMGKHCETDILIDGGYQESRFVLQGMEYNVFDIGSPGYFELGPAVASWSKNQTALDKVLGYENRGNYYTVINENNYELLSDGASKLFCAEDDFQGAQRWYSDPAIYKWFFQPLYATANQTIEIADIDPSAIAVLSTLDSNYDRDADSIIPISVPKDNTLNTYYIFSQSRDGVIESNRFPLQYYESEFYICNAILDKQDSITYYLQPLPTEINSMLLLCQTRSQRDS